VARLEGAGGDVQSGEVRGIDPAEAERLREVIVQKRSQSPSKKWRAPDDLRSEVLALARRGQDAGASVADVAGWLGMVESTLYRWLRSETSEENECQPGLSAVAIVPSQEREVATPCEDEGRGRIRLITPDGYVLEGLDRATAIELLRVIG